MHMHMYGATKQYYFMFALKYHTLFGSYSYYQRTVINFQCFCSNIGAAGLNYLNLLENEHDFFIQKRYFATAANICEHRRPCQRYLENFRAMRPPKSDYFATLHFRN